MNPAGTIRTRVTIFMVSLVTIVAEIALMRELALRFWEHLAWLVISIALLGFGISGTVLVLLQRYSRLRTQSLSYLSLLGLALSIPLCLGTAQALDLDLIQMVWQPAQFWRVGLLELLLALPFIFGGMYVGLALQDEPVRVPGHYGASFIGSGMGGILVLFALFAFSPRLILLGCSAAIIFAALFHIQGTARALVWLGAGILTTLMIWQVPREAKISIDKDLPQLMAMPGSEILASRAGPQGLVRIVEAPAFHGAPGLSLANTEPVPAHRLVTLDGQIVGNLYRSESPADFSFLDNTTMALPYRLNPHSRVLIGSEAGTAQIGLALYHGVDEVTALTDNRTLAKLKNSEMSSYIGHLYQQPHVSFFINTLRGFLYTSNQSYSLIAMPLTGADFGGLKAATPNSLFTLETFTSSYDRLDEEGMLSVTTQAHVPPRESLRLLNMVIEVLKSRERNPRHHIAMIRSWATVTVVATKKEITADQGAEIRSFCRSRGFDLVWLPELKPSEVNRHHVLDEPQYYLGATNLLGAQPDRFISGYAYDLTSPDDGRPFFHHFSRQLRMGSFADQLGGRSRSYAEIGTLLLVTALSQAFILALVLIVLPMVPAVGIPGEPSEQLLVIGFFSSLGFGFMLLEMGLLQRLEIYLGHPVYSAAAVLSGFLFFGGLGSIASAGFKEPLVRPHCTVGLVIAAVGVAYLLLLDTFLVVTEGWALPARMTVVLCITGPLAMLMGMMFPLGLKRLGQGQTALIPWAWSVNGFTSVLATLLAPLLAMHWGFGAVIWAAVACYAAAALLSLGLPAPWLLTKP